MKTIRFCIVGLLALPLCGCLGLEVDQHPPWVHGEYQGKRDNLPQQAHFHNDRLAWMASIANRNHLQNEYGRAPAPGP